ncbi:aromatic prenyltransferase, partial [Aspergillus brunneoviolaceus CBS 621.78]
PYTHLSQYLTHPNRDHHAWWTTKAPLLTRFLQDCNYTVNAQYQYLTLFHNQLIPYLGIYTEPSVGDKGNTLLSGAGKLEIDRTFTATGSSLRIAFEPTSYLAGEGDTGPDPLNVLPLPSLLSALRKLPGVDVGLDRYRTLSNALTTSEADQAAFLQSPDLQAKLQTLPSRTQNILALDLIDGSVRPELYFQPQLRALATNADVHTMLLNALQGLNANGALSPALKLTEKYLTASPSTTQPLFISSELSTSPNTNSAKLFLIDSNITLDTAQALWTWGRPDATPHPLQTLWESLGAVEGVRGPTEFPMMLILKLCEEAPFVRPQVALPVVGMTEQGVGEAVVRFFAAMGWETHAAGYLDSLRSYYPDVELGQALGKQAWIALSEFDGQGPALTIFYY